MATFDFKKLVLCFAAAATVAGCTQATPANEAASFDTSTTAPAAVDVSTRFQSTIFSEIRPQDASNLTCFTTTSYFSGSEGHGDVDCVEGTSQPIQPGQTARVAFQATIGKTNLFTVYPATRPDVVCRVTTSVFNGSEGGGHLSCTRVTPAPTSSPAL